MIAATLEEKERWFKPVRVWFTFIYSNIYIYVIVIQSCKCLLICYVCMYELQIVML